MEEGSVRVVFEALDGVTEIRFLPYFLAAEPIVTWNNFSQNSICVWVHKGVLYHKEVPL